MEIFLFLDLKKKKNLKEVLGLQPKKWSTGGRNEGVKKKKVTLLISSSNYKVLIVSI